MIKVLGFKRVVTLACLLAANIVLAGLLYGVLTPQMTKTEQDLRRVRGGVTARRTEVATLKTEYEQIQEQKSKFEDLERSGFFQTQDRVAARKLIEDIQAESSILSARYDIQAINVKEDPIAAQSDYVILHSPVKVSLDALDDIDVYSFIYWMENAFPGHAGVHAMTLERKLDVDEVTLKQIGNGVPAILMSATVDFSWNTMVKRADIPQQLAQPAVPQ
jgi:hypothetical protein